MSTEPRRHHEPSDLADRFAPGVTRLLRFFADTVFAKRYGHRAIVLEHGGGRAWHGGCDGHPPYTLYLAEIDGGRVPNVAAPAIARRYWKLADDATLRDVVLVVRADEAHHRDVNHGLANQLSGQPADPAPIAPYPEHADATR